MSRYAKFFLRLLEVKAEILAKENGSYLFKHILIILIFNIYNNFNPKNNYCIFYILRPDDVFYLLTKTGNSFLHAAQVLSIKSLL